MTFDEDPNAPARAPRDAPKNKHDDKNDNGGNDNGGNDNATSYWSEDILHVRIPDGRWLQIAPRAANHPLLGSCDAVYLDDALIARFQAVDWRTPQSIPALDQPGILPPGAGTAILNTIAQHAPDGQSPLRYRGPYPTATLFDALLESFRVTDPPAALKRFTADVESRALAGRPREIEVDFFPAPFHRQFSQPAICVQIRDGLEKVFLAGRSYARDTLGPRRLRERDGGGWIATVELAGQTWAHVAHFERDGKLIHGPHPLPHVPASVCGQPLPEGIRAAIAQALPPRAPALMRPALVQILAETQFVWADTGDEVALPRDSTIAIHAGLLQVATDVPPLQLLEAIARAVEPVVHRMAQSRLLSLLDKPKT